MLKYAEKLQLQLDSVIEFELAISESFDQP